MENLERRNVAAAELRIGQSSRGPVIEGYAAVFDSLSDDLGGFVEKIDPEAFKGSMGNDVRATYNHDPNLTLGRTKAGTLEIRTDEHGLHYRIFPPSWAENILETIRRGDVSGSSFAFRIRDGGEKWEQKKREIPVRTVTSADLIDVGPVVYPAYPDTDTQVAARSLEQWRKTRPRKLEHLFRMQKAAEEEK